MKDIAAYIRVSSRQSQPHGAGGKQEESLPKQKELLSAWHATLGIPGKIRFFQDDRSGSEINRPGLNALIEAIENREVEDLLIFDDSRLARNQAMAQAMWHLCRQHQVIVWNYAWRRRIDLASAEDAMLLGMTGLTNETFLRSMRRQCHDGAQRLVEQGCWPWSKLPFGYIRDKNKRLEPVEPGISVAKRIFDEIGQSGLRSISLRLEADRQAGKICDPRTARPWRWSDVKNILTNPAYTGAVASNRRSGKKELPRSQWKIFPNAHPAIVSPERFEEIQRIVRGRWRGPTFGKGLVNDVAGMAYCGHHDRMLVSVHRNSKPGHYFQCHSIGCPNNLISAASIREVLQRHPDFAPPTPEKVPAVSDTTKTELARSREAAQIRSQIAQIGDRRRKMVMKFAAGEWTRETLDRESIPAQENIVALKKTLLEVETGAMPNRSSSGDSRGSISVASWLGIKRSDRSIKAHKPCLRAVVYERTRIQIEGLPK